jgi:hypothetical protein
LSPSDDVRAALERLSDHSVAERQAAERWLASNLDPGDLDVVAEIGAAVGLEGRTRLSNALGSDDRHFGLGALLAADYDPGLRRIGTLALERMIARWYGEDELLPLPVEAVEPAIADQFPGRLYSMHVGERSLDEEVAAVARRMGRPAGLPSPNAILGIAVDPLLYERQREGRTTGPATLRGASARRFEGTADFLLLAVALWRERITVEGFGFNGPHAWLHVVDRDQARTRAGNALLVSWCRDVLEHPDRAEGEGAARALAGTGWPAALAWMAERWFEHGDRNALAGLLLAAERGHVVPGLASAASVERLLRAADRALSEKPDAHEFPEEVLRSLGAMGPIGSDGADLAAIVAEDWERARGLAGRLRLGVLAEMGAAPDEVRARLRAILSAGPGEGTAAAERLQLEVLRTLAATAKGSDPAFVVGDPAGLGRAATALGLEGDVLRWLQHVRARPPEAWSDPARLPGALSDVQRIRLMDWWFAAEPGANVAGAHLLALALGPKGPREEELGDQLALRVRRGARHQVEAALARAAELGGAGAAPHLERLALLAGLLPEERQLPLFERLIQSGAVRGEDLALVAMLAAGSTVAEPAQLALAAAVEAEKSDPSGLGMEAPWVRAYARTLTTLRRRARDADASQAIEARLLKDLREELRRSGHPLTTRLRTEVWPPPPGLEPVPIEPLEVHLDR